MSRVRDSATATKSGPALAEHWISPPIRPRRPGGAYSSGIGVLTAQEDAFHEPQREQQGRRLHRSDLFRAGQARDEQRDRPEPVDRDGPDPPASQPVREVPEDQAAERAAEQ